MKVLFKNDALPTPIQVCPIAPETPEPLGINPELRSILETIVGHENHSFLVIVTENGGDLITVQLWEAEAKQPFSSATIGITQIVDPIALIEALMHPPGK